MRLSRIKLSGFKSFVDTTTIPFPSNLIGIVGPNGCGKSNVIDAVRWVMGESSAKHLRGESMADVIFNGSSTRKPVGQAAIELVFDNTDGTIGGEYAKYNEISIKRVVSRDGQSVYFQNGTRCRRRDITDIFLGTGLGPRGYSIIEQGMISRLIEARPEDLRVFLEEAAGISKYKERRRETENRIKHTRENMERLTDLRDELGKQLAHLQRQSTTAERYKVLKQEERLIKAQLTALRWHSLDEQIKLKDEKISEQETRYESVVAKLRSIEAEIEKQREQHIEASEAFNEVQAHFYSVGSEITRLEQSIQHTKERSAQHERDLKQTEISLVEAQTHLTSDQNKLAALSHALETYQPELEQAREREAASASRLEENESRMQQWQRNWEEFNEKSAEPARQAEVERTRIEHFEKQILDFHQRKNKLQQEQGTLSSHELESEIQQLSVDKDQVSQSLATIEAQLNHVHETVNVNRQTIAEMESTLSEKRERVQDLKGRRSSLQALQQSALGKHQNKVNQWLQDQGIGDKKRLAESLQVESGWETAVECVLGGWLEAVCVDDIGALGDAISHFEQGNLNLFNVNELVSHFTSTVAERLSDKVSAPWKLDSLLAGVFIAEDLQQAMGLIPHLDVKESVITKDGLWVGKNWLRVSKAVDEKAGVLQREQELQTLNEEITVIEQQIESIQAELEFNRQHLQEQENNWQQQQTERQKVSARLADLDAKMHAKSERLTQIATRIETIQAELTGIAEQLLVNEEQTTQSRGRLGEAIDHMGQISVKREELQTMRDEIQGELQETRSVARHDREMANELNVKIKTVTTELTSVKENQSRMQQQSQNMTTRRDELISMLGESEQPLQQMGVEREAMLLKRVEAESRLSESRRQVETLDQDMRALSSERVSVEQQSQKYRNELDQMRLAWQESSVRRTTQEEALAETGYTLEELFAEMPEGAIVTEWEEQVEKMAQRLQRLGPINLAAIDEYKQQSERKEYLDAQHEDLFEALTTLENAIKKIDRETRTRFKETYEKVNDGFKAMFPRLFGGGHAYLELTGEDLLDTGVTVMARPPGKKNSTIHLLSGGEKALTAVALVFAIFQLNPAPFCMLDEVDAPLDDANVVRFCQLVKEMSEHVQFIVITHNKVTMEMAHQLNGVTMYEPGCSRIVAVDVQEAAELGAF